MSPESDTPPSQHAEPDVPHGDKVLVISPTYNERENLPLILDRLDRLRVVRRNNRR